MALKATYDKVDDIPEAVRSLYVERDGKHWLDAEGVEDVSGLKSALEKQKADLRDLKSKLKDFDDLKVKAGDYDALKAKLEQIGDAELLAKGAEGLDELVARRTERAVNAANDRATKADEAKAAAEKAAAEVTQRFHGIVLEHAIQQAAVKAGIRPTAIPDVARRARDAFKVEDADGKLAIVARDDSVIDKRGHIITPETWFRDVLPDEAPHYWDADKGGGAGGAKGGGVRTISRTDQAAIDANIEKIAKGEMQVV